MTILIFIIFLSVIVFVHELGHFVMAKRAGMKVDEFGFGFPPRIFGKKIKDTIYSINWIPFGGFVKIQGENETETRAPGTFGGATFWQKFSVIVAGVLMNVVLAFIAFSISNIIGYRTPVDDKLSGPNFQVQILQVSQGSPADQAGLKLFDEIIGFQSEDAMIPAESVIKTQEYIRKHRGKEIELIIRNFKSSNSKNVIISPRQTPPECEGALGVVLSKTDFVSYSPGRAVIEGAKTTGSGFSFITSSFGSIIKSLVSHGAPPPCTQFSGPVGIAIATGEQARLGFAYLLQFVAFISLNLAVINLVPFPALDGGRLLFLIIEKLKGSPIPKRFEQAVNSIGFVLLLVLMVYITVKDVSKFF